MFQNTPLINRLQGKNIPLPLPIEVVKSLANSAEQQYAKSLHAQGISRANMTEVGQRFLRGSDALSEIQHGKERQLVDLAVRIVREHFGMEEGEVLFKVTLGGPPYFMEKVPHPTTARPDLQSEIDKRRLINALSQGAAHKLQYSFLLKNDELEEIAPGIIRRSYELMAAADWLTWSVHENEVAHSGDAAVPCGGYVKLDLSTRPPTVISQAMHFPVLVHELTKGVQELLALAGLPPNRSEREHVLLSADRPEYEVWDLRLGPALYEQVMRAGLSDLSPRQRSEMLRELYLLPAQQFNEVLRRAASGDESALREFIR